MGAPTVDLPRAVLSRISTGISHWQFMIECRFEVNLPGRNAAASARTRSCVGAFHVFKFVNLKVTSHIRHGSCQPYTGLKASDIPAQAEFRINLKEWTQVAPGLQSHGTIRIMMQCSSASHCDHARVTSQSLRLQPRRPGRRRPNGRVGPSPRV
jgi:hypothetical protein